MYRMKGSHSLVLARPHPDLLPQEKEQQAGTMRMVNGHGANPAMFGRRAPRYWMSAQAEQPCRFSGKMAL